LTYVLDVEIEAGIDAQEGRVLPYEPGDLIGRRAERLRVEVSIRRTMLARDRSTFSEAGCSTPKAPKAFLNAGWYRRSESP